MLARLPSAAPSPAARSACMTNPFCCHGRCVGRRARQPAAALRALAGPRARPRHHHRGRAGAAGALPDALPRPNPGPFSWPYACRMPQLHVSPSSAPAPGQGLRPAEGGDARWWSWAAAICAAAPAAPPAASRAPAPAQRASAPCTWHALSRLHCSSAVTVRLRPSALEGQVRPTRQWLRGGHRCTRRPSTFRRRPASAATRQSCASWSRWRSMRTRSTATPTTSSPATAAKRPRTASPSAASISGCVAAPQTTAPARALSFTWLAPVFVCGRKICSAAALLWSPATRSPPARASRRRARLARGACHLMQRPCTRPAARWAPGVCPARAAEPASACSGPASRRPRAGRRTHAPARAAEPEVRARGVGRARGRVPHHAGRAPGRPALLRARAGEPDRRHRRERHHAPAGGARVRGPGALGRGFSWAGILPWRPPGLCRERARPPLRRRRAAGVTVQWEVHCYGLGMSLRLLRQFFTVQRRSTC